MLTLPLYDRIKIVRHVKVQGSASPMDPALRDYWDKRQKARLKALMVSKKRRGCSRSKDTPAPSAR